MNNNSKLTEEYRAEVTDILNKISLGLGLKVIECIEPKLATISSETTENSSVIKSMHEKLESFHAIHEVISNLEITLEKINAKNSALIDEISKNIKSSENKFSDIIESSNQIQDQIRERITTIEKTLEKINLKNTTLIDDLSKKFNNSDFKLSEVITSNNKIQAQIKEGNTAKDSILFEIEKVSNRILKIENDKTLLLQVSELNKRQQTTEKFVYLLIALIIGVLALEISSILL